MQKYSVFIANDEGFDDIAQFDTLEEAIKEIKRQKFMDGKDDLELLYGEKFIYAVRDNINEEVIYKE
jgi:hypothetical protein